ncbi:MAG: transposase, partial [Desulfobacterales bacterium]|nr:transposase [Desulfobacterales bacterium]
MKTYAGIDLHSSNSFLGVIDEQDTRLYSKRLPNDLETILSALKPFQDSLKSVVIESTYNWYWLVDGLMTAGYPVNLANPSAIKQYEGLKNTDDKWDSFWLAHMKRLGILPEGYIYPKEERPIRDLLRRRMLFVQQRTTQILSFQTMVSCVKGFKLKASQIKKLTEKEIKEIFDSDYM